MKTRMAFALAAVVLVGACAGNSGDKAAEGDAAAASFRYPPDLAPVLAPHLPRAAWAAMAANL